MAATYSIAASNVSFALNKSMIALYNGSGSGQVMRVYRVWMINTALAAVTGGMNNMELRRTTAGSGGTTLTPGKHDSTNAAFHANVIVSTNQTVTVEALLKRWVWSTDEPVATAAILSIDELECTPGMNCIWDVGYGDTGVEPITLREGYGLSAQCTGSNTAGAADLFFEVTMT